MPPSEPRWSLQLLLEFQHPVRGKKPKESSGQREITGMLFIHGQQEVNLGRKEQKKKEEMTQK